MNSGAIQWVRSLPGRPGAWALLALTGVALEAVALWFQYVMDLQPCVYCIYIRVAVFGLVFAAVIGLAGSTGRAWLRRLGLVGWGVSAGYGLVLSWQLYKIQNPTPGDLSGSCSFVPQFPEFMPLHEWFPGLFMPTGSCIDPTWYWLGLSMAQWTGVTFVCYLVALAVVLGAQVAGRS